jgi:transposase InsO family protein
MKILKNLMMSLNQQFEDDNHIDKLIQLFKHNKSIPYKYKDYAYIDNHLIYKPLNLIVVKKSDIDKTLQTLYNDEFILNGKSVLSVYKYIITKYMNITRNDVQDFLNKQHEYKLISKSYNHVRKPITEKAPNRRWQIDLIDLGENIAASNYGRRYIVNVVDVFSRYSWIRFIGIKSATVVLDALIDILHEINDENDIELFPNVIQSDNGGEFMGEFDEYLQEKGIKHIINDTYTPTQNAIVERSNKQLRELIKAMMIKKRSKRIYNFIPDIQESKNNTYIKSLKASPKDLWEPNKDIISVRDLPKTIAESDPKQLHKYMMLQNIINKNEEYKQLDNYKLNDLVYVKMSVIFSSIRKMIKKGLSKNIVVVYAPIQFRIYRVIESRKPTTRTRYYLMNTENDVILSNPKTNMPRAIYASDILPYSSNDDIQIDIDRALLLNQASRIPSNDLIFE